MQRAHTGARAQWKSRLLGRALAPRARHLSPRCWRFALRGPLSLPRRASLRRSVVASSLSGAPGFVVRLGVFGCVWARSRSQSFLQFGLVAPCCVLILGQVCPRNRTHTSQVTRSVCAVCPRRLRVLGDADTRHTLRSFTRGKRNSLRARREFVPPACPRRHEHSAQTLRSFSTKQAK